MRALSYPLRWLRAAWRVGPTRAAWRVGPTRAAWVLDYEARERRA